MISKLLDRIIAIGFFVLTSTNFANTVSAYASGPYGQRKGFLEPKANSFVVGANATFSLFAASACIIYAFKK